MRCRISLIATILCVTLCVTRMAWGSPPVAGVQEDAWSELEGQIRALGLDPEDIQIPGRLNHEMQQWVHERVSSQDSPDLILRRVLEALVDPRGFKLAYDSSFTGTAQEVWATKTANCLGFTHLFVGLTRELGVPSYYVRWSRVERFRREGDLVLVSGHVSAGYGAASQKQILEFGAVEGYEAHLAQPISDLNAVARHYANRGAEHLRSGDVAAAVAAAETATILDPTLADAWVNLGVARRRSGDSASAEEAYLQATLVDPEHVAAYQNISILMYLRGDADAARKTLALLDRRNNRNPYIYLALGDDSMNLKRYEEADRFYGRAYKLGSDLAETRAAKGLVALALGDLSKAKKWLRRARAVDAEDERTVELADKLSRSGEASK